MMASGGPPSTQISRDELLHSFDNSFQFLIAFNLHIISYFSFDRWSSAPNRVLLPLAPFGFHLFSSQNHLCAK